MYIIGPEFKKKIEGRDFYEYKVQLTQLDEKLIDLVTKKL